MRTPASARLWLLLALALLVALLYYPSTAVLYEQWSDFSNITYTHGWLIVLVCVALVIQARRELSAARAAPSPLAQALLVLGILSWLICYRASIQDLHITIFPALFWLAVVAAWGWRVGRLLAFPVAFFYFAVPSWSQLSNPLQELTILAMQGFLKITGPPAVFQGDLIHIPNGSFIIEEGCSGLHFLIVGLAVAALHGELRRDPWRTRALQLLLMTALALLANWVRVYTVIEAGYLTDMRHYLVSVSHYWFGWGVFAVALVAFFWLTTWLSPAPPPAHDTAPVVSPERTQDLRGFLTAALLLALLPGVSAALRARQPPPALDSHVAVAAVTPWMPAPLAPDEIWQPVFAGADRSEHLAFTDKAQRRVEVFRAQYREQRQGAELVGSSSSILGPHLRWRGGQIVSTPAGRFAETEAAAPDGTRSLIWSRYEIAARPLLHPLCAQLWYGLKATVGRPRASLVALGSECVVNCQTARDALQTFLERSALR